MDRRFSASRKRLNKDRHHMATDSDQTSRWAFDGSVLVSTCVDVQKEVERQGVLSRSIVMSRNREAQEEACREGAVSSIHDLYGYLDLVRRVPMVIARRGPWSSFS